MKKKMGLLIFAISMLGFAVTFIIYALNHPEASFPWNNTVTYSIYFVYLICMVACFIAAKGINGK